MASAGRVFRASTGMLYLAGGRNGAAGLHTPEGFDAGIDVGAWSSRLARRRQAVTAAGSRFVQLIVPEKLAVYPLGDADRQRAFPGLAAAELVAPGRRLLAALPADSVVYPEAALRRAGLHHPVYLPTDSHWTWPGAFAAFLALMDSIGQAPESAGFLALPQHRPCYHGDLWEADFADIPPHPFLRFVLPPGIRRVYANPLIGLKERCGLDNEPGLHAGSHCVFHNSAAQFPDTVVLFGSSFSECRLAPSLLTAIFAWFFAAVHFVWSTSVDAEYVARHQAAITVAEMPERFLTSCPDDSEAVEAAATERLRLWHARRQPDRISGPG